MNEVMPLVDKSKQISKASDSGSEKIVSKGGKSKIPLCRTQSDLDVI